MEPAQSSSYDLLSDYIKRRMRMSHIYQPLMLMELLGRSSPAPAEDIARQILGEKLPDRVLHRTREAHGGKGADLKRHHIPRRRCLQPDRSRPLPRPCNCLHPCGSDRRLQSHRPASFFMPVSTSGPSVPCSFCCFSTLIKSTQSEYRAKTAEAAALASVHIENTVSRWNP